MPSAGPPAESQASLGRPGRPALRADAERNRRRIITAARQVFAERGLDVPMEDIARRARVGVATLYRRFPTRGDLIAGAFRGKITGYADAVTQALADPDPWAGFCGLIERLCAMQAEDRGFACVLTMTFPMAGEFQAERDRAYHGITQLTRSAQAVGQLRADFVPEDLAMLLMANAGVLDRTADAAPGTWRRFAAYMIQAFSAAGAAPLPPPPTPDAMHRALLRRHQPADQAGPGAPGGGCATSAPQGPDPDCPVLASRTASRRRPGRRGQPRPRPSG
jgi:AcrR family transcriptional regulator